MVLAWEAPSRTWDFLRPELSCCFPGRSASSQASGGQASATLLSGPCLLVPSGRRLWSRDCEVHGVPGFLPPHSHWRLALLVSLLAVLGACFSWSLEDRVVPGSELRHPLALSPAPPPLPPLLFLRILI